MLFSPGTYQYSELNTGFFLFKKAIITHEEAFHNRFGQTTSDFIKNYGAVIASGTVYNGKMSFGFLCSDGNYSSFVAD